MDSPEPQSTVSPTVKRVASCAILFYLFVLILGPLSNPVGSEHLTRPLAEKVKPIHHALFLGHGYRFFAPDPGPSHLVEYEITKKDGTEIKGRFPDRDDSSHAFPRLQYHRWFMLSETIWSEHSMTPPEADFLQEMKRLESLALEKKVAGHHNTASRISAEVEERKRSYKSTRKRIDDMVRAVARNLIEIHDGEKIRLVVREREIPYPVDVEEGVKLDDPKFLKPNPPPEIGFFTADELNTSGGDE